MNIGETMGKLRTFQDKFKINTEKLLILFFLVMGLYGGCMFTVMTPVGIIPDEMTHLEYALDSCGLVDYYRPIESAIKDSGAFQIKPFKNNHLDIEKYKAALKEKNEVGLPLKKLHLDPYILKYFPTVAGFIIGGALKLPYLRILQLCSLLSLAFYLFMGVLTIKAAPVKKYIFTFCLLLPMSLHMAASINYDTILIPFCFFLTAYLLKLKCGEEQVKWKDILILMIASFFILYIKVIYVLLILMILTIPLDRFDLKIGKDFNLAEWIKKYKLLLIVAFLVLICLGAYLFRNNNYVVIMTASLLEWKRSLLLFRATWLQEWESYKLWYVGCFGSLDVYVPKVFANRVLIGMLLMILYFDKKDKAGYEKLSSRCRIFYLLIVAVIFVMIFLAMITWTLTLADIDPYVSIGEMRKNLYKFGVYLGIQGRYFIPITPLFMLSLSGIGPLKKLSCNKLFYPVFFLFVLYIMQFITRLLLFEFWV